MALAIFDLDETLIHGDCATLWSEQMGRLGWVDPQSFMQRNNELMAAYSKGELAMEVFMDFSLEPLIGRTPEEVAHLVGPWVEDYIEPIIFSDATKTIAAHRKAGDRILVISASGTHLVKPIAERLGVDEVLGIELEVKGGIYTGNTVGTLTYREGKITRLLEWLESAKPDVVGLQEIKTETAKFPTEAIAAAVEWTLAQPGNEDVRSVNAVVGETNDGFLNDIRGRHVRIIDARQAIESAATGPVAEGNVGAGTGKVVPPLPPVSPLIG